MSIFYTGEYLLHKCVLKHCYCIRTFTLITSVHFKTTFIYHSYLHIVADGLYQIHLSMYINKFHCHAPCIILIKIEKCNYDAVSLQQLAIRVDWHQKSALILNTKVNNWWNIVYLLKIQLQYKDVKWRHSMFENT